MTLRSAPDRCRYGSRVAIQILALAAVATLAAAGADALLRTFIAAGETSPAHLETR